MEGNINRNEQSFSKNRGDKPLTIKHAKYLSVFPNSHAFSKHAERMKGFRHAHSQIQTAKSEGNRAQLKLLPILPSVGISVMLRNSRN